MDKKTTKEYQPRTQIMSQKEVTRKYKEITESKEHKDPVQPNRVNCYKCQSCGHITKTIDVDNGVTPFIFDCEKCKKEAFSSFYKDTAPDQEPTFEWYRPSLSETMKLRKKEFHLEHVLQGGLLDREIPKSKKPAAKSKKPAVLDLNKAENIELTFRIGSKLYIIEPKGSKLDAKICMQTVLRLALNKHKAVEILDADIMDLEEKF